MLINADKQLIAWNDHYPDTLNIDESLLTSGLPLYDLCLIVASRGNYGDADPVALAEARVEELFTGQYRGDISFGDDRIFDAQSTLAPDGSLVITYTDITERKAAEEKLRQLSDNIAAKEAQLRMALDTMPGAMWLVDKDLKLVFANEQYAEIYGDPEGLIRPGAYMPDIIKHESESDLLGGEGDAAERLQARIESYQSTSPSAFEDRARDGRFIQLLREPIGDGHVISVATDITELKQAEQRIADAMGLINESIQYASRIQRSVLPTPAEMADVFDDHLAIWQPKDVVGGDIYLLRKCEGGTLLFVADCTGHGVPGAFMTMIATGALDQAIIENPGGDPGALLNRTNQLVKTTLGQLDDVEGESDDGFECGLCLIAPEGDHMVYAGARFELRCIDAGDLLVFKGDRCGIGYRRTPLDQGFTNHQVPFGNDAMFYLFSDGMTDQIGGAKRRAFGKRRLRSNLKDYYPMALRHQEARLMREFEDYQHKEERRDDITLIGFRLKPAAGS